MAGMIKCAACDADTNIPVDIYGELSCSGCQCTLAILHLQLGYLNVNCRAIGELTLAPEIKDVEISDAGNMTAIHAGSLTSLGICRGYGESPNLCVYARSIKLVNMNSPVTFSQTHIDTVFMQVDAPVPACENLVLLKCSVCIPASIPSLTLFNMDEPDNSPVIHQLINNGNPALSLEYMQIETLRYPSTLTKLEIKSCDNLRQIIPPANDNLRELIVSDCYKLVTLPAFARLSSLTCLDQYNDILIPFMPSIRELTIRPYSRRLADIYHFSERMDVLSLCDPVIKDRYLSAVLNTRRLTRMHARVHVIERWWIEVAHSPPCSGQPAGGVFYRKAMAAFMAARA